MKKLLKLPLRLAALPIIAMLLVFQLISSIIVGLTSIVTTCLQRYSSSVPLQGGSPTLPAA